MDPEARRQIEEALRIAREALALADSLKKQVDGMAQTTPDSFVGAGSYAASSPSADGTIPITFRGQRYNVLVDKV